MARSGWQLRIRHSTLYRYDGEVTASYNEVRLSPMTTGRQVTLDARVEVQPATRMSRHHDYWGTLVYSFDLHQPHTELQVVGRSVVETSGAPNPGPEVDWAGVDRVSDRWSEFLLASHFAPEDLELVDYASAVRHRFDDPRDAVREAVELVNGRLAYVRGSTSVSTTGPEAWRRGSGVCQDFAPITIGILRSMGIPARYVSGYLHPSPEAPLGEEVVGESHAWVEAWLGAWEPFDPTGLDPVAERHVVVARGRDYGDVPPFKGIFTGAASPAPEVEVELVRSA